MRLMPQSKRSELDKTGIACPADKMYLPDKTYISFKGRSIAVAACPYCNRVYSNSTDVLQNKIVLEDGREVIWSHLQIIHADKPKERRIQAVTPEFCNLPITVMAPKSRKALLGEHRIKAINRFPLEQKGDVILHGYLNVQTKEFSATPEAFTLKKIPAQVLPLLDIKDPENLLSTGKKSRKFLLAWEDAISGKKEAEKRAAERMKQQELHRQAVMDSAYPGQLYTVPLLRSGAEYKCPYCGRTLLNGIVIKCVVYRNFVPHHCIFVKVSYCKFCNIPISTQDEMAQIRKEISPNIVKVVYADSFPTKDQALAACYEKVKKLEHRRPPEIDGKTLPYSKESWGKELPNLSTLSACDSIFIYAKKCSCQKCQRKFDRDTITDRKATVLTKSDNPVDVNVQFCMGCGRYFMNLKSFYTYQKLYGDLKISLHFETNIPYDTDDIWINFARDSVLSRNGYNVKAGTSRETRQEILCRILNEGFATKHEVITLLTQFIQLHQTAKPEACARWREDLLFVNQFEIYRQDDAGKKELLQGARINMNQKE